MLAEYLDVIGMVKTYLRDTGWGRDPIFWIETITLALCAPFLIFPSRFPWLTAAALSLLILVLGGSLFAIGRFKTSPSPFKLLMIWIGAWSIVAIWASADPGLTVEKGAGLLLGLLTWRWCSRYIELEISLNLLFVVYGGIGIMFVGIGFLAVDWLDKIPQISAILAFIPQQLISFSAIGSNQGVQPNQLAGTILWVYPVLVGLAFLFWSKHKLGAILFGLAGLSLLFVLLLSQSRGGWLGGLIGLAALGWFYGLIHERNGRRRYISWGIPLVGLGILVSLFVAVGPATLSEFWSDPPDATLVGNLSTLSFRQEIWMWGVAAIRDFPLTGTGLGTFRVVVHRLYPLPVSASYDVAHAHNVFIQVALDLGVPGLFCYLGILGMYLYLGIRLLFTASSNRILVMGLLAAMIGFHVYGLVDTIAIGAKPGLLFWLLLALMDGVWRIEKR